MYSATLTVLVLGLAFPTFTAAHPTPTFALPLRDHKRQSIGDIVANSNAQYDSYMSMNLIGAPRGYTQTGIAVLTQVFNFLSNIPADLSSPTGTNPSLPLRTRQLSLGLGGNIDTNADANANNNANSNVNANVLPNAELLPFDNNDLSKNLVDVLNAITAPLLGVLLDSRKQIA